MKLKHDKGVAGLSVLLSVITALFIIGLLVLIFVIMGANLGDATGDSGTIQNESLLFTNGSGSATSVASKERVELSNVLVCIEP
jgi:hypothetical protein